jgi:hypothetical protein
MSIGPRPLMATSWFLKFAAGHQETHMAVARALAVTSMGPVKNVTTASETAQVGHTRPQAFDLCSTSVFVQCSI